MQPEALRGGNPGEPGTPDDAVLTPLRDLRRFSRRFADGETGRGFDDVMRSLRELNAL